MLHLLKLFNDAVVEIQGFNDSQFDIFKQEDRKDLTHMWFHEANRNPNKFISLLSPDQKDYVSLWTLRKVNNTSLDEIIQHLTYTLQELQNLADKYKGTLDKPQRINSGPKGELQVKAFEPVEKLKVTAKDKVKDKVKDNKDKPKAKVQSGNPGKDQPPPYDYVIPSAPPLYPTLTQVLNDYSPQPLTSEYTNVKKVKGYMKDMKKIEALGDKYNLTFSQKAGQGPLRTRDVSRARLKSGLQSLKSIVMVPTGIY